MLRNWQHFKFQVQSFLRGWICRRKWKTIIQDYIRSPHAESMRKRNQVVFSMLDSEAEYVQQLHILVNNFLRPLRMAASSKKPPITHDDVSSIFLNRLDPLVPQSTPINCLTEHNHLKGTRWSFLTLVALWSNVIVSGTFICLYLVHTRYSTDHQLVAVMSQEM